VKKNSFALLELEMTNLGYFFKKNGLGPLGIKIYSCSSFMIHDSMGSKFDS
jgi:hypothetical protein